MDDPITRARAAAADIEHHRAAMSQARAERRAAITEARTSMTAADIAQALGISTARVYRILSGRDS